MSRETVPRWQKLTADDFADTPLSDTDEEVDVGELTVANSENWSQTLAAGRYYARVNISFIFICLISLFPHLF